MLGPVPVLIMKKTNEGTERVENVHRQLKDSPSLLIWPLLPTTDRIAQLSLRYH